MDFALPIPPGSVVLATNDRGLCWRQPDGALHEIYLDLAAAPMIVRHVVHSPAAHGVAPAALKFTCLAARTRWAVVEALDVVNQSLGPLDKPCRRADLCLWGDSAALAALAAAAEADGGLRRIAKRGAVFAGVPLRALAKVTPGRLWLNKGARLLATILVDAP